MLKKILLPIILLLITVSANSQSNNESTTSTTPDSEKQFHEIKGVVQDMTTKEALPYTNIYVLHKNIGAISNELGFFSINTTNLDKKDTLRFQYIGYQTKKITVGELLQDTDVFLNEEIFNLNETIIFGNTLNAKSIVKNVIKNKDLNYKSTSSRKKAFIRERYISDIVDINLIYKKSSFAQLDKKLLKVLEEKVPRYSTSYTDFLGNLYFSDNEDDSLTFKVDPIRTVSLKEKDIAELEQIQKIFENIFKETNEEEYWKVKSGILSQKIEVEADTNNAKADSLKENEKHTKYFNRRISYKFNYALLNDKDDWEFLYSTGKYNYTLVGGTRVNAEDVYIIDFAPKSGGAFIGRMYISMSTYALIRADYEYAPDKTGTDFHLFGVGYTENMFSGSIYFERHDSTYRLKYFSKKAGSFATFDRNIALIKKRERFLFDKKIEEIKVGVEMSLNSEQSVEILILDDKEITHNEFASFNEDEKMEIIYVDQFDDKLWQGFSIIEPTKKMREYKKREEY